MITNKKYISYVFPLALLVGSMSIFAMEKNEQRKILDKMMMEKKKNMEVIKKYYNTSSTIITQTS